VVAMGFKAMGAAMSQGLTRCCGAAKRADSEVTATVAV
jgi:hypothetical protein